MSANPEPSTQSLTAHQQILRNFRIRVFCSVFWLLVFAALLVVAFGLGAHWLIMTALVIGFLTGVISLMSDLNAIRDRKRIIEEIVSKNR